MSINSDGSGLSNLTEHPSEDWAPTWSPDGSQIAFQTDRDGNWEIYSMAADGSDLLRLTNDPADDQLPFWRSRHPDNRKRPAGRDGRQCTAHGAPAHCAGSADGNRTC